MKIVLTGNKIQKKFIILKTNKQKKKIGSYNMVNKKIELELVEYSMLLKSGVKINKSVQKLINKATSNFITTKKKVSLVFTKNN